MQPNNNTGGVYSFGAGSSGQLGHTTFNDECNPKMITELMGTVITQVRKETCSNLG